MKETQSLLYESAIQLSMYFLKIYFLVFKPFLSLVNLQTFSTLAFPHGKLWCFYRYHVFDPFERAVNARHTTDSSRSKTAWFCCTAAIAVAEIPQPPADLLWPVSGRRPGSNKQPWLAARERCQPRCQHDAIASRGPTTWRSSVGVTWPSQRAKLWKKLEKNQLQKNFKFYREQKLLIVS